VKWGQQQTSTALPWLHCSALQTSEICKMSNRRPTFPIPVARVAPDNSSTVFPDSPVLWRFRVRKIRKHPTSTLWVLSSVLSVTPAYPRRLCSFFCRPNWGFYSVFLHVGHTGHHVYTSTLIVKLVLYWLVLTCIDTTLTLHWHTYKGAAPATICILTFISFILHSLLAKISKFIRIQR
jgi:hypothetical protein